MDNRPIGVFDSGLGGLTAVKMLREILPNEQLLYFGDTGRVPYGTRSSETILRYAKQDMRFLLSRDVKAVVVACGTVSSVAAKEGAALPVPYIDVLRPTARAAARATRNGRIAIIGTSATIASGSYRRELAAIDSSLTLFEQACPLFVPLVENAFVSPDDEVTRLVTERYLASLRGNGVDTMILGCTHYPIISETIRRVMGDHVTLIDSGREAALHCSAVLSDAGLLHGDTPTAPTRFFVSDTTESFYSVAALFLGERVEGRVERIDIERYE